jgi:arsenate reductase
MRASAQRRGWSDDRDSWSGSTSSMPPHVLFLCIHNAGRSQMAAGWLRHLAAGCIDVSSAGSEPADSLNPAAVEAMREVGIDIASQVPERWTDDALKAVDLVVTMGCGDECPVVSGTEYLDWPVADPAGQSVAAVRPIRDELKQRVEGLIEMLTDTTGPTEA